MEKDDGQNILSIENDGDIITHGNWLSNAGGDSGLQISLNGTVKISNTFNTDNKWISGDGGNEGISIDDDGNVGIGTNTPSWALDVTNDITGIGNYVAIIQNTADDNTTRNDVLLIKGGHSSYNSSHQSNFIHFEDAGGNHCGEIKQTGNSSLNYGTSSDRRLKENIRLTQFSVADLMKIEVQDYNYITDHDTLVNTGFIAQDLYKVYPNPVGIGGADVETNPWNVDYGKLTPILVKSVQDQQKEINQLKSENEQLKAQVAKINDLQQQNAQMQAMLEQIQAQLNRTNAINNEAK